VAIELSASDGVDGSVRCYCRRGIESHALRPAVSVPGTAVGLGGQGSWDALKVVTQPALAAGATVAVKVL
jgi:hypothetical protein